MCVFHGSVLLWNEHHFRVNAQKQDFHTHATVNNLYGPLTYYTACFLQTFVNRTSRVQVHEFLYIEIVSVKRNSM